MTLPMLLLLACVSKGDHELIQVQLDATRMALSAKNADCYEQTQACEATIERLEAELVDTRGRLDGLDERYQQLLGEVELTRMSLANLVTSCEKPPEDPCPRRGRKPPEEPPEPDPLVQATIDDVHQALALRSRHLYEEERRRLEHDGIASAFGELEAEGRLSVHQADGRSVVRIPVVQLFNEHEVSISPRGGVLVKKLAAGLRESGEASIQVVAHTDDKPYHTAEHDSAWELGFDQAMTLLRALQHLGVTSQLSAATYAGELPIASNDTPEGRKSNRRLELVFGAPVDSEPPAPAPPDENSPPAPETAEGDDESG